MEILCLAVYPVMAFLSCIGTGGELSFENENSVWSASAHNFGVSKGKLLICSPAFQEQKEQICFIVVPLLVEEEGGNVGEIEQDRHTFI